MENSSRIMLWWCLLYSYVRLRICLIHVSIAIMIQEILILCILRISLVVLSISSNNPIIMITIFQHLNWCSNSCWLLFNNNKQHHWVSIPSYTFDFEQRVHLLLSGDDIFEWSVQRVHCDASCDSLLSSGPVPCIRSVFWYINDNHDHFVHLWCW